MRRATLVLLAFTLATAGWAGAARPTPRLVVERDGAASCGSSWSWPVPTAGRAGTS